MTKSSEEQIWRRRWVLFAQTPLGAAAAGCPEQEAGSWLCLGAAATQETTALC